MSTRDEPAPTTENEVHFGDLNGAQDARMRDLFDGLTMGTAAVNVAGDGETLVKSPFFDLFRQAFAHGAIIAGGAAVYVLVENVPRESVGDVDIFVPLSDHAFFMQIAREADAVFERLGVARTYWAQQSAIKIIPAVGRPIQIILSSYTNEGIIKMFDLDYVQCALTSPQHFIITELARRAHDSRTVSYAIDDKFNPMRLVSRLRKAQLKGFKVPEMTYMCDLGVKLYRPRPCTDDAMWVRELQMCVGSARQITHIERANMPANAHQFPSLDAMCDGYRFVEITARADYDDVARGEDNQHKRVHVRVLRSPPIAQRYVRLCAVVRPESREGSLAAHIESRIAQLRSGGSLDPFDARKVEYHIRALALMIDGSIPPEKRFQKAMESAIADSTKLDEGRYGRDAAFAFGQLMEMHMWRSNGGATCAHETEHAINRLFS